MKRIILAAFVLAIGTSAIAQTRTKSINQRQKKQERRIDQGINTGALTPREAGHLAAQQARIQQHKLAAKSDGKVTTWERARLDREQDRASRAIYRQKHDAQTVR